jgi:positive regulator of sigma E activity
MKPSIPEIGTVINLKGDTATVMLKGGESCKGCGQAEIGLCKIANTNMILTVKNPIDAKIGDNVTIDIDRATKTKGYLLAFITPLSSLILGAIIGNVAGKYLEIPSFDVIIGFMAFFIASFFSFRKLKSLDSSSSMVIKSVISESKFSECKMTEEAYRYSR